MNNCPKEKEETQSLKLYDSPIMLKSRISQRNVGNMHPKQQCLYRFTKTSRWKHPNTSCDHRSLIRQNITKNIICHDCVKLQEILVSAFRPPISSTCSKRAVKDEKINYCITLQRWTKPALDYEQAALQHCQHTCGSVQHQGTLRQLPLLFFSKTLTPGQHHKIMNVINKVQSSEISSMYLP